MKYAVLFLSCAQMAAQSLQILPLPATAGGPPSFQIMIVQPGSNPAAALEWRISVPDRVTIALQDIKPGQAAAQAQKSLACVVQNDRVYHCLLAGGLQPIPDGPVAEIRLTVTPARRSVLVSIGNILGATGDAQEVSFPGIRATLTPPGPPRPGR